MSDTIRMDISLVVNQSIFPSTPKWKKVFDFIESNFKLPISLHEVAKAVDYNPAYLTNKIKTDTGLSVNQWIRERRMKEAYNLLLTTDAPVTKIAENVGFQTLGHFFIRFQDINKTSPKKWRSLHRRSK